MKIAVSANGENLDAQLDPRFGRCAYFLLVNPKDMSIEAFNNESVAQGGGAGIQAAQFLVSKKVAAVFTGNCGPNAVRMLSAAGVKLFGGQAGTVKEVVERFKKGRLKPTNEANLDSQFGMKPQAGMGRGKDAGRGMGGGMKMSDVSGQRRMGVSAQTKNQELKGLKQQADSLNRKMKEVISRINRLELQ